MHLSHSLLKQRYGLLFSVLFIVSFSAVLMTPSYGASASEKLYSKADNWADTMAQSRAKYVAWSENPQEGAAFSLGPWYVTNPLKVDGFSGKAFPEKRPVDLAGKFIDGSKLWMERKKYVDGAIHTLPGKNGYATYLYRVITAPAEVAVEAAIGSDDGVAIWLNGEQVHSKDVPRGVSAGGDKVAMTFKAGENKLLMKIYNRTGGHGFYFSLGANPLPTVIGAIGRAFPEPAQWLRNDFNNDTILAWFGAREHAKLEAKLLEKVIGGMGELGDGIKAGMKSLFIARTPAGDAAWLRLYERACVDRMSAQILNQIDLTALGLAIEDLTVSYGEDYLAGEDYAAQLASFKEKKEAACALVIAGDPASLSAAKELAAQVDKPLLANPLLDFEKLLLVRRKADRLGLPQNWQGNCSMAKTGYDNEIVTLPLQDLSGAYETIYRPEKPYFVGDVDLHFDGDKMLFSMPGSHNRWQIFEMGVDGSGLRQVTLGEYKDVDNYDACYLPDERIIFASSGVFHGVPCVGGSDSAANLYLMNNDGSGMRQLCFDQDHNWCPTVLNNGRVLFTRWEYTDTAHYFTRVLFHMNPDGTNQMEYYGSNSFWPNSMFYARPIPGDNTKFSAIVTGHHGVPRMGELVVFDTAQGRFEGNGVIQRIPGRGKPVEPKIMDQLVASSWPKFLHPFPLSAKYFLVSCKPNPSANWGLYLVDTFDNMTLLREEPGYALFEPIPLRSTERPPTIPDKVDLKKDTATVYLADIYAGEGLRGVPRGTVKSMRLIEYHYSYNKMGGHIHVGVEGPWDIHRILGTVPVYADGSASFTVPANMPIGLQPLDAEGKAIQLMRSWFTAMPGEVLSCVGCHEKQSSTPLLQRTIASQQAPVAIEPWYGPARGFSFAREVQPVLDRYCIGCHNGEKRSDDRCLPNFTRSDKKGWYGFSQSYLALHPFVRRPGPESDYHVFKPAEYEADTSELVQMLRKGHKGVKLDAESWDRLITWIDLNVPAHGTWTEHRPIPQNFHQRRLEMRSKYAMRPEDPEVIIDPVLYAGDVKPMTEAWPVVAASTEASNASVDGWPLSEEQARSIQAASGETVTKTVELGEGITMTLSLIPAGTFIMGSASGAHDEQPTTAVTIDRPYWMAVTEVTNAQYNCFDPQHHNGYIDQHHKDHTRPGYTADEPDMPVIRISWEQAVAFCGWLSERSGLAVSLPTEAQWEWACRAGAGTPMSFGDLDADFSAYGNMADVSMKLLAVTGIDPKPIANPNEYQNFMPQDARFDDKQRIMTKVAQYQANAWGLFDMHGNVAEWTCSTYSPYPYNAADGRNALDNMDKKVVRGGSWRDRPKRSTASYRLPYKRWQPVFNVGFRVVCMLEAPVQAPEKVALAQ